MTNIDYERDLLQTQVSPADQAINIRCTTDTKPSWYPETKSVTPPASNDGSYVLYFAKDHSNTEYANNRFLSVGKWGTYDEVQAGTAHVSRMDQIATFKHGSVVGLSIPSFVDDYSLDDILFNPSTTITPTSDFTSIPHQTQVGTIPHTVASLRQGLGDPCRLAGYYEQEISDMLNVGTLPDNRQWRLPTYKEWAYIVDYANAANYNGTLWRYDIVDGFANYLVGAVNAAGVPTIEFGRNVDWKGSILVDNALGVALFPNARRPDGTPYPSDFILPAASTRNAETGRGVGFGEYGFWASSSMLSATHPNRLHIDQLGVNLHFTTNPAIFNVRCVPQ